MLWKLKTSLKISTNLKYHGENDKHKMLEMSIKPKIMDINEDRIPSGLTNNWIVYHINMLSMQQLSPQLKCYELPNNHLHYWEKREKVY